MASSESGSGESSPIPYATPSPKITPQTTITSTTGVPTHFRLEHDQLNLTLAALPPHRDSAEMRELYNATHDPARGQFVNVGELPAGDGGWEWLEDVDRVHAVDVLGLADQEQVELMRQAGIFTMDTTVRAGPSTVWLPNMQLFNPVDEPDVEGHWEFHLTADRDQANINFAGQALYGLANDQHPSAAQIWRIRQVLIESNDLDATNGINLVWVPTNSEPPATIAPLEPNADVGHSAGQLDPNSGLRHAPTNRGENDQTGSPSAAYHTLDIRGTSFTLDRSRAHATIVQPHKTWIVTNKGVWQQWSGAKTLDWLSKTEVEKLNKWKEQALKRNGWPPKRWDPRPEYTDEEKAWLMGLVVEERRTGRTLSNEQVTLDFNARFPPRDVTGITAILHRLRKQLEKEIAAQEERDAPTS
ncbi:hypothetical protein LTR15_002676 [Elasticomyces elasticus]|nr:hypothetical protein LTR15_002676 [Elasticomyces elasticus]